MIEPHFLLIANPENRRATMFAAAAASRGCECDVVGWLDLLRGADLPALLPHSIIRVESPGENWDVERGLIRLGRAMRDVDPDGWDSTDDVGRVRGLGDAYRGLCSLLRTLPTNARYFTAPPEIAAMFDKVESKRRLAAAGLITARTFGVVRTFGELDAALRRNATTRAFVKPRHGSSASGVIALSRRPGRVLATTSLELEDDRLYNSLNIRRYDDADEVRTIVDLLGREDELLIEEWIPKASAQRATFDLRAVPIGEQVEHAVMRLSKSPMTNLHLGNARGDLDELKRDLGERWRAVENAARRSIGAFPRALYAGVDIGLTPGLSRIVVFEINAFGDLLPGIVDSAGRDTYVAQIDALRRAA